VLTLDQHATALAAALDLPADKAIALANFMLLLAAAFVEHADRTNAQAQVQDAALADMDRIGARRPATLERLRRLREAQAFVRLAATGKSDREIARRHGISRQTVNARIRWALAIGQGWADPTQPPARWPPKRPNAGAGASPSPSPPDHP
jgi:DNA-binding NarL/FixJ family response regulator